MTKKGKITFFKYASVIACLSLILMGVVLIKSKNHKVGFPNPVKEVTSVKEMEKLLGFDVPVIEGKDINSYIVIGNGEKAIHGRIRYIDTTQTEIEKVKDSDVSGIYGGTEIKKETIDGIEVTFMSYDIINYATWSYGDYSYSCSIEFDDTDYLEGQVKEYIASIKE